MNNNTSCSENDFNAIILHRETLRSKAKERKEIVVFFDIFDKKVFTVNADTKGFQSNPTAGDVYKLRRTKFESAYNDLQVIEWIGSCTKLESFFRKYKLCINYPEINFEDMVNVQKSEINYYLVNFTNTSIKEHSRHRGVYQIKATSRKNKAIFLDLLDGDYSALKNQIFKGRAIVRATKQKEGNTRYQIVKTFGRIMDENEWKHYRNELNNHKVELQEMRNNEASTEEIAKIRDAFDELDYHDPIIEDSYDYSNETGFDSLDDTWKEHNEYNNYEGEFEVNYFDQDEIHGYSGDPLRERLDEIRQNLEAEHEMGKKWSMEWAKNEEIMEQKSMLDAIIKYHRFVGPEDLFYKVWDRYDDRFSTDYSTNLTKIEELPRTVLENLYKIASVHSNKSIKHRCKRSMIKPPKRNIRK